MRYYHNLVEDEKEAYRERFGLRVALVCIVVGMVYLLMRPVKKEIS